MITLNNQDITSLVDITSITTNDTLDESLASGSMIIPLTTQNTPYARFSEVRIDGLLFVVAEDIVRLVKKTDPKQYRHEISLIEPTKILQKRVIPNLTVTQPQGDIQNYIFSVNRYDDELLVNTTQITVPLVTTSQSQDTNVIDGLTLKNTDQYEIYVSLTVENNQYNDGTISSSPRLDFEIEMFYGTTSIETKTYSISGKSSITASPIIFSGAFTKRYTPSIEDDISFKVRCLPPEPFAQPDQAKLTDFVARVAQPTEQDLEIKLDEVVDKLLQFHPQFTLSETTRTRIEQTKAPEFTFQNYTLYDALKEVANYVSAIVYLGEDDFSTIYFYFYDQVLNNGIDFADQEQTEYLDGFTDGFEINATNVIRDDDQLYAIYEPDQLSWMTVRGTTDERGVQIIDTQTALQLEHGIYRPIQVLVKGLAFEMRDESNQVVNFANTQVWDITNYVVEQQRYNTFESEEVTNARGAVKRKSNTIYYVQGQPLIQGLGFTGTVPPAWNTNLTPNFAIVEAILNTAQDENPTYSFTTDYLLAPSIHDLQFRIRHIPYSSVRLTVYKDNTRGRNIMYFNEQANLNDMELLGKIAQENVNRSGNRVVRYEGLTSDNQLLLGSKNGNEVLVNYTISRTPTINKFVAEYAVGYANLSNYVGIDSRLRQYEVPNDTIVSRRDKLTQFFTMTTSNTAPAVLVPDYLETQNNVLFDSLFANFKSSITGSRPTYARVIIDGDKVVQSTIDAYRMGKTLGLAINMLDNYSAGIKKRTTDIANGTEVKLQEDARYTDDFGRFTSAEIEFYDGGGAISLAESDLYPDNNKVGVSKLLDYTYTVNKDAREQWGFIYEIVFQSDLISPVKTVVYDGFVKYNRLATEITPTTIEIRFLEKGYLPDRNLDINRTTLGTGTVLVPSGERYLQIQATAPVGQYEGLILTINDEPIIAIQSSDYDFNTQVTKYIYPRAFEANDYELGLIADIFLSMTASGFVTDLKDGTASATINTAFTANGQAQEFLSRSTSETITTSFTAVGNIFFDDSDGASETVSANFNVLGQPQESLSDTAQATISTLFNIVGNVFLDDTGTTSDSISTNFTAIGNSFIEQDGTMLTTVSAVFNATGNEFIEQSDSASETISLNLNATGAVTTQYNLRGYATATPVNIVVDFDDVPAFGYTLQTFTQTIGTKDNGTDVTVTAPSSYTLNGITYTFVDWRVDETGQSSTNRIFTTTIDQQKTLRLRYIAFGV
jgi:hypothetical protein